MLYKYLPPERLDVIKNLKIRFTQPSALNDPFESATILNVNSLIADYFRKNIKTLSNDINIHNIDNNILNKVISDTLCQDLEFKTKVINHTHDQIIPDQWGVLSLSRSPNIIQMWSHYASSGSGFVLGLRDDIKFSCRKIRHSIIYTKNRKNLALNYPETNIDTKDILGTKSIEWSYEEEERIIIKYDHSEWDIIEADNTSQIYLSTIQKDYIEALYFGPRSSDALKSELIDTLKFNQLDINIYDFKLSDSEFRLEPIKI